MKIKSLFSLLLASLLCSTAHALGAGQDTFSNPKDAVQAVIKACKSGDTASLVKIFGPEGKDIVISGDPSDDKDNQAKFVQAAERKYKLIADPMNKDKMILSIGKESWPFPIPLIRQEGKWFFDTAQGREEMLARRIGANELTAIEVSHAYVEAQFEYAQTHQKNGVPEYAKKIVSSSGKQDGLYWDSASGAPECEVPKGFADAAMGMSLEHREPYHGYYFRILTAQGPDARGGAMSYIVNGTMIGGFALVAWPAEYGVSGVQTFIVNHDGTVYESHLGAETVRLGAEMTEFNPDKSWKQAQ